MTAITPNQVSCIIPYAGASKYIEEVVGSAVAQQFSEVIVVNDGFPAEQLDLVSSIPRVRTIHLETSGGCANARNIGIKACKTPYVVLLDHDDVLCKGYLEAICAWIEQHHLRCAAGTLKYIGESTERVGVVVGRAQDFVLPSGFLSETRLIAEVGFFPDSYSDDVLLFRAIRKIAELTTCPTAHVLYRIHPQAESSRNAKAWWAFNQLLPLYYQGSLNLRQINVMARDFANDGVIPAGLQLRFNDQVESTVRVLSRSAYACWLNRDFVGMSRYCCKLMGHLPELARLARRKWMPKIKPTLVAGGAVMPCETGNSR
jgi:glycosyltransferase involved in cell wall biosynthesis